MSLLKNGVLQTPPSIRARYIRLTLLLGLLVIAIVFFFYGDLLTNKQKVADDYVMINDRMSRLDTVRGNLVDIYRNINLFLLDPSHGNYADATLQLVDEAITSTTQLSKLFETEQDQVPTQVQTELATTSVKLNTDFTRLRESVIELIATRMDVPRQYPGMAVSAFGMTDPQQAVSINLQILIDEIEGGELQPVARDLYPTLLKTHALWLNQISQVRIYLANRFAAFSDEILVSQAISLSVIHQQFLKNIDRLNALYAHEDSFEGNSIIKSIKADTTLWYSMFKKVRLISESDMWRTDNQLMKINIIPLTDEIADSMIALEELLHTLEKNIAQQLREDTETLTLLLFIIIALFLSFIFAIILSLNWMIFNPVTDVVRALKLKAFGKAPPPLQQSKSREIGDLVEAFREMDKQVSSRQRALMVSEKLLRTIADNYPNSYISVIESDFTIGFTSGQEFKKLGLDPEQFIGQTLEQVFGDQAATIQQYYTKAFNGEECEFELFTNNQYLLYHAIPLYDEDNFVPRILAVVENITERKQAIEAVHESVERYRTIFEGAPEGVWLIGPDRRTIEINKRLCDILGYEREEMIGKTPLDFADEANQQIFKQQTGKIETTARREYEIELRHKDGHNIPTYFSATTLRDSNGDVLEAVAFVTDLTEQKSAQRALRRAQKMDAIGQLTGGIAHDFNNILGVILGNIELLEGKMGGDEKSNKRLGSIKKASNRAASLTQQLLGFSRRKATEKSVSNINQIVAGMENLINRSVTPEVGVQYHLADDLALTRINPGEFEDALLNLCINARDAMAGHGHLIIETSNTTLDESYCEHNPDATVGNYVELSVSDSGEGIPKDLLDNIFEPFFTTKDPGKGTGLGLSMVYGFVKRSGGCINVYSEAQAGTTFRLYLPMEEVADETIEEALSHDEDLPTGNETILAVDDEVELLDLAQDLLEALGYRVLTATNGHEAFELLASEPEINLLFSDVVMPGGINGYELAEQATASNPNLKVLLTSGYTEKAIAHNGQARFNANLLSKPYSQNELAKRVREILESKS